MHKPCDNCPFRKDIKFYLDPDRKKQIVDDVINGDGGFPCHKTVNYRGDRQYKNELPCIGAALLIENTRGDLRASFYFRMAVMAGYIDPEKIDRSVEVCSSIEEFLEDD